MFNGWLILDKPLGMSSAQAVDKVKRLVGKAQKIGHGGTLDPLASGVLPIALGEATKTVQFAMDKRKSYRFCASWGEARSTDDAEGEVTARSDKRPQEAEILAILPRFTGKIMQTPPAYSAMKVNGKRAYALARAGEAVELSEREVDIFSLSYSGNSSFDVSCGKGTYIRSLCRDMALALGTVAYVSYLRRTGVGKFNESSAISLEKLEEMVHNGTTLKGVHPVESMLDDIPAWEVDSPQATKLRNGLALTAADFTGAPPGGLVQIGYEGKLLAICNAEAGLIKPVRVFNL